MNWYARHELLPRLNQGSCHWVMVGPGRHAGALRVVKTLGSMLTGEATLAVRRPLATRCNRAANPTDPAWGMAATTRGPGHNWGTGGAEASWVS